MEDNVSKVLNTLMKQQSEYTKEQSKTNRWLSKLNAIENDKFKEINRHSAAMEKISIDKLETKKNFRTSTTTFK